MDAIQNSLQQKLSRLSQVDSFFSSSLHSSYEYPLFPHSVSPNSVFLLLFISKLTQKLQKVFNNIHSALIRLQFLSEVSDTQGFWCCFYPFVLEIKRKKRE